MHLAAGTVFAQTSVLGTAPGISEKRVKAAYLYRFIGYTEWPAASFPKNDSPYVIGILQDNSLADEIEAIAAGRTVNNRPVLVKRMSANDVFNGLHILFINDSERGRQAQWLRQLQQQPVLLVTETEGALTQGSMINFRLVDDRVRFEVALGPVERAGLKLNSRLLGVALTVIKGSQ